MDIEDIIRKKNFQEDLEEYIYNNIKKKKNPFNPEEVISRKVIISTMIQCTVIIVTLLRMIYLKEEQRLDNT